MTCWSWPARAETLGAILSRTDWACVNFQVVGVCHRATAPYVGVRVRYRQPVLIMETVKTPGHGAVEEMRPVIETLLKGSDRAIASAALCKAQPDSGNASAGDTTTFAFNDVHVYGYPLTDQFSALVEAPCEGVPDLAGPVAYLSEWDASAWRVGESEKGHPMLRAFLSSGAACGRTGLLSGVFCLGEWGPLYPRTGFLVQPDPVLASAVMAYRAVDIASFGMLVPHRVIMPVQFLPDRVRDRMQLVSPAATSCLAIGQEPFTWDRGLVSENGEYVWLYWRQKECCLF